MKKFLAVTGILLGVLALLAFAAFLWFLGVTRSSRLDPARLRLETEYVTLLGANGEQYAAGAHKAVPLEEMPASLPNAFVAVEDKRFYTHSGFDYRRIVKAALKNLSALSFREGASTISQQLIKNTHLTNEKTLTRKLKEVKLTRLLEKKYSKDEIMALYLNSIYFGHSAFGVDAAARFYFSKSPAELLPAESALLAALVRSPNRYSPFKDAEACLARRNYVLKLMREQGYLDETEYADALSSPLPTQPSEEKQRFFFTLVREELEEILPGSESGTYGKLTVETAYDAELQSSLDALPCDCDITALVRDNRTGCLKALRSTIGLKERLPASTIKPLLVYGPAVEENLISPATPILDERTDFGGYMPDDAGGASGTYLSARYALAKSVNIPAVKILNSIGCERAASYLARMGLDVEREDLSLALALGGMRHGFTLKALADGYATFANGGNYAESGTILRVTDETGKTLYERPQTKTPVFSEETAFLVTDMLRTAAKEGTARKLKSLPIDVAAKTGTHEVGADNIDAYTIAYTKADVVAVWLGNADGSPVNATGGGLPATFAKEILTKLYEKGAPPAFRVPDGVVREAYDRAAYETEHRLLRADPLAPPSADAEEYFKRAALPTETSTRFSHPRIQKPSIEVANGSVNIVLCQEEYYDYEVKRVQNGAETVIYRGPYRNFVCDNSVIPGESYVYTVTPYFGEIAGDAMTLPRILIPTPSLPDDWWE